MSESNLSWDDAVAVITAPGERFEIADSEIRGVAVKVFKKSMIQVQDLAAEQARSAEEIRTARDALETLNLELESKVEARTAESGMKESTR